MYLFTGAQLSAAAGLLCSPFFRNHPASGASAVLAQARTFAFARQRHLASNFTGARLGRPPFPPLLGDLVCHLAALLGGSSCFGGCFSLANGMLFLRRRRNRQTNARPECSHRRARRTWPESAPVGQTGQTTPKGRPSRPHAFAFLRRPAAFHHFPSAALRRRASFVCIEHPSDRVPTPSGLTLWPPSGRWIGREQPESSGKHPPAAERMRSPHSRTAPCLPPDPNSVCTHLLPISCLLASPPPPPFCPALSDLRMPASTCVFPF